MAQPSLEDLAERRLKALIRRAFRDPSLRRLGPKRSWTAEMSWVGAARMQTLNRRYRRKNRPTDVLSFGSPEVFRAQGYLGELVICLPILRRQAREQGHTEERELEVLLAHGLLHLLGLDHERGPREAARMARFERQLLGARRPGLLKRSRLG